MSAGGSARCPHCGAGLDGLFVPPGRSPKAVSRLFLLAGNHGESGIRLRGAPAPERTQSSYLNDSDTRVRKAVTREQADKLITCLPEHLAAMVRFSLETGLRKSNVTGMQWSQVDIVRRFAWIHPDQAKARKAIPVPLSSAAVEVVRQQIGKHLQYVFTYKGRPVKQVNTKAWTAALARAGIKEFRWHDLRHTWASWHVQAGTPMYVLQELGAWESPEMVQKYAHLSSDHLAQYVERVSGFRGTEGAVLDTKIGTAAETIKGSIAGTL